MQNIVNQSKEYRLYSKAARQWFTVSREQYEEYDRERTAFRKRMQDHGCCSCPRKRWWQCDMMCDDCEYRINKVLSLDAPEADGNVCLADILPDDSSLLEDIQADRDELKQLIARLYELDPDADALLEQWQTNDHISDRAIARMLNCPQRTFADRIKRIRTELRRIREC
jgi:DNA-directed RNA polymerase specialized sigma24 family protein